MKKFKYNEKDTLDYILEYSLIFSVLSFIFLAALGTTTLLSLFIVNLNFRFTIIIFYVMYCFFITFISIVLLNKKYNRIK